MNDIKTFLSLSKLAEMLSGKQDVAQININVFMDAETNTSAIEVITKIDGSEEFIHKETFSFDECNPSKELHDMVDRALAPIKKDKRFTM